MVYRARPLSAVGCQKTVVAPLADYLRRVPGLGPCFGNDDPDRGSVEARRSSGFTDVVLFGVIGGILLALSLARRQKSAEAVTADMVVPNGRSARTKPLPALR